MYVFPFNKPVKVYTLKQEKSNRKIILPNWYSKIELGNYSFVNDDAKVYSFRSSQTIKIGKYSSIGRCSFYVDGDHNIKLATTYPFKELGYCDEAVENKNIKSPATVGNDVWIADQATIYGNVNIGNGAVIAGQSVVTKDVPDYAVVAGNPSKIVKFRFNKETISHLQELKWWDLPHDLICSELAPVMDNIDEFILRLRDIRKKLNNNTP
jgi:acetyltransferase-like isoleucine patch superfamily enzyme